MKKKIITILALVMASCMLVSACGGGSSETKGGSQNGPAETAKPADKDKETEGAKKSSEKAGGISLTDYTDPEFSYTMLAPETASDVISGDELGCSLWVVKDKNDEEVLMIAFSEYDESSGRFSDTPADYQSADKLLDLFKKQIGKVCSTIQTLHPSGLEAGAYTYDKVSAGSLDGAGFKATLKCDNEKDVREYGFAGVCVLGEKRPYVFWALDLTGDMSRINDGYEIIKACVKNFKEGN